MTLRVARARVFEVAARPVRSTWSAHGAIAARGGLLLVLEDERGARGQGEASPLPGWSIDSTSACHAALARFPWNDVALDLDDGGRSSIAQAVARIDAALPAARCALESALIDLAGHRLGVPAHAILSGRTTAAPVPLSALLTGDEEAEVIEQARAAVGRGIHTLKWKIGRPGAFGRELGVLRALRLAVGAEVALRLDANGAFALDEAAAKLGMLAELSPALVEEPAADWLDDLPPAPVPLAADESLCARDGWAGVERAIRRGACAAVVLKPMLLGGALACLDLARRAAWLGAGAIVTHAFDGPVALMAAASLALALPPPVLAAGLDRHAGLDAWPPVALPRLGASEVVPGAEPGLGLPLLETVSQRAAQE